MPLRDVCVVSRVGALDVARYWRAVPAPRPFVRAMRTATGRIVGVAAGAGHRSTQLTMTRHRGRDDRRPVT